MLQLTVPTHEHDSIAAEAAQVFYSRNEFLISIGTVRDFVAWRVGNNVRPSDLVTRLAVLYGPPHDPGGGNGELVPLLSMPRLQSVRLVFQDHKWKGLGPYAYLRPSFGTLMELRSRTTLTLQLKVFVYETTIGDEDGETEPLQDITVYLSPPTPAELRTVDAGRRALREYRGSSADVANSLVECGWTRTDSEDFILLSQRAMIADWTEKYRLASQDVEMC